MYGSFRFLVVSALVSAVACGGRTWVGPVGSGGGSGSEDGTGTESESGSEGETTEGTTTATSSTVTGPDDEGWEEGPGTATATSITTVGTDEADGDDGVHFDVGGGCGLECCEPNPDDEPCRACAKARCCEQLQGCFETEECACVLACLGQGGNPMECFQSCGAGPDVPGLQEVFSCVGENCPQFCG
jgi:hypothetical protein